MAVLRTVAFLPIPHSHSVIPTVEIQPARPVMEHRVVSAYAYACARVCVSVCLSVCVCVSLCLCVSVCVYAGGTHLTLSHWSMAVCA